MITFILFSTAGLIYFINQQNLRNDTNNPQIQIAQDIADNIKIGKIIDYKEHIDVRKNLATITQIYNDFLYKSLYYCN